MGIYLLLKFYLNDIQYSFSPLNYYIISKFYDIYYTIKFQYRNIHLCNYTKRFIKLYFQHHYILYIDSIPNLHIKSMNNNSQSILYLSHHHKQTDYIGIYLQSKFYQISIQYNWSLPDYCIINMFYDIDYTITFLYHNIHLCNNKKRLVELYLK